MEVVFRCKRSSNTCKFSKPDDIASMRKDIGYEEVKNESKTETSESSYHHSDESKNAPEKGHDDAKKGYEENAKVLKKRGRPAKK